METGDNTIVEANRSDSLCTVGKSLFDPDLWDTNSWQGQNLGRKTLMSVRQTRNGLKRSVN